MLRTSRCTGWISRAFCAVTGTIIHRYGAGPLQHRRPGSALPYPAAVHALELFDVPRQLTTVWLIRLACQSQPSVAVAWLNGATGCGAPAIIRNSIIATPES